MDQIYSRPDRTEDRFDHDPEISYTMPAYIVLRPRRCWKTKSG